MADSTTEKSGSTVKPSGFGLLPAANEAEAKKNEPQGSTTRVVQGMYIPNLGMTPVKPGTPPEEESGTKSKKAYAGFDARSLKYDPDESSS